MRKSLHHLGAWLSSTVQDQKSTGSGASRHQTAVRASTKVRDAESAKPRPCSNKTAREELPPDDECDSSLRVSQDLTPRPTGACSAQQIPGLAIDPPPYSHQDTDGSDQDPVPAASALEITFMSPAIMTAIVTATSTAAVSKPGDQGDILVIAVAYIIEHFSQAFARYPPCELPDATTAILDAVAEVASIAASSQAPGEPDYRCELIRDQYRRYAADLGLSRLESSPVQWLDRGFDRIQRCMEQTPATARSAIAAALIIAITSIAHGILAAPPASRMAVANLYVSHIDNIAPRCHARCHGLHVACGNRAFPTVKREDYA